MPRDRMISQYHQARRTYNFGEVEKIRHISRADRHTDASPEGNESKLNKETPEQL